MANIEVGSKVEYTDDEGNNQSGVIHGIKKADVKGVEKVIGYLVDTGETLFTAKQTVGTGKKAKKVDMRQPEQVEVTPENIRLKK